MSLASAESFILLQSVTNKKPNSGSSESLNRVPLIFLRGTPGHFEMLLSLKTYNFNIIIQLFMS